MQLKKKNLRLYLWLSKLKDLLKKKKTGGDEICDNILLQLYIFLWGEKSEVQASLKLKVQTTQICFAHHVSGIKRNFVLVNTPGWKNILIY